MTSARTILTGVVLVLLGSDLAGAQPTRSAQSAQSAEATQATQATQSTPINVTGMVLESSDIGFAEARVELVSLPSNFASGQRRLRGLAEPPPVASATSDARGRFLLRVPSSGVFKIVVRAAGRLPMQYFPLVLTASIELSPVLPPPARNAELRVEGTSGQALGEVWVFAQTAATSPRHRGATLGWRFDFRTGLSDGDGRVVLPRADSERLTVAAFPAGAAATLQTGFDSASLTLSSQGGVARQIRVVDHQGVPAAGLLVRMGELAWPVGMTDLEGGLELFTRPGEAAKLRFYSDDGYHQMELLSGNLSGGPGAVEWAAEKSRDPDTFELRAAAVLEGRIVDAARRPMVDALVWLSADPGAWVRTDGEGRYRIVTSPAEKISFQVEAPGHVPQIRKMRHLASGAQRAPTLTLVRSVKVRGRVSEPAGKGLTRVHLAAVRQASGGPRPFLRPDPADSRGFSAAEGRFEVRALEPGQRYELLASRPGFTSTSLTFVAPAGGDRPPFLELVLEPSRGAIGRVVNLEEAAIASAEVSLSAQGSRFLPRAAEDDRVQDPSAAETDEEGRFRVGEVPATEVDLRVQADGYAPVRVRGIEIPPGEGDADLGTIVLVPGAAITGRVLDEEGEGVEGTHIHALEKRLRPDQRAEGRLDRRPADAMTDPEGRFEVRDLAQGGQVDLVARARGYLQASLRGVSSPPPAPVTMRLKKASGIRGRVLDENGAPIRGAAVGVDWRDTLPGADREIPVGRPVFRRAISDEEGYFEIVEIRPGKVRLRATKEDFVGSEPREHEVPGEGAWLEVTLVLESGAVVEGLVATAAGDPVAGLRVAIGDASAFSDADGVYHVGGIAEGPATAEAFHPHYQRQSVELEVEPGVNALDWILAEGQEVAGRVVDAAGDPLAGARLRMSVTGRGDYREYRQRAATDGTFRLAPVADGRYRLEAEREGYAPGGQDLVTVAGEPVMDLEIVLEPGAVIAGRILGLEFDELADVRVTANRSETGRGWSARVSYDGEYEIVDLPPGDWRIRAVLRAGERQTEVRVPLAPGASTVRRDIEFGRRLTLTGHVFFDDQPLAEALVSMRGFEHASERSVTTDYQGEFRVEDLEPGSYWLGLRHDREWLVHNDSIELEADRDISIRLSGATVAGQVVDAASLQPIAEAIVALQSVTTGEREVGGMLASAADRTGTFSFPRVNPGTYRLKARKDGYAPFEEELVVRAGQDVRGLNLELAATRGLDLQVRLASGAIPPYVDVHISRPGGGGSAESRPVDAEGRAHLATIPAGSWEILVTAPGGGLTRLTATVPGDPVLIVLPAAGRLAVRVPALASSNQIATLTLTDLEGRPFRDLDAAGSIRQRWPLVGGKVTLDRVPAGSWALRAETPDGQSWSGLATTSGAAQSMAVLQ